MQSPPISGACKSFARMFHFDLCSMFLTREGAPRQIDRRVCAAAKGVFFKKAKMHCKGGPFDKCTVRVEISVNVGKTKSFCPKSLGFLL